jgi:tRNA-specific 2-thiouridylase
MDLVSADIPLLPPAPDPAPHVVVAMSGGVDSSVAAALLVAAGYRVTGMMMRLWSEPGREGENRCCTPDQMAAARQVAHHLAIPFYALDVRDHFHKTIVRFFLEQHAAGLTPNPCIECNRRIRFGFLLEQARALEADFLATGHYARIRHHPERGHELWQGVDVAKDQSYVLHVMTQAALARTLFPVGEYSKPQVRALADRFGLPLLHRQESMDLCFLGNEDYRAFLQRHGSADIRPGPILNQAGELLGTHSGLAHYTPGQRKGLGISSPEPLFVIGKEARRNALIVGPRSALGQSQLVATQVNWINGVPGGPLRAEVKVRYKNRPNSATLTPLPDDRALVVFDDPVEGIAPGQGAVFYHGERCLGGGLIAPAGELPLAIPLSAATATPEVS